MHIGFCCIGICYLTPPVHICGLLNAACKLDGEKHRSAVVYRKEHAPTQQPEGAGKQTTPSGASAVSKPPALHRLHTSVDC